MWAFLIFGIMAAVMIFGFVFQDKTVMKRKPRKVKKRPDPFYMDYFKKIFKGKRKR